MPDPECIACGADVSPGRYVEVETDAEHVAGQVCVDHAEVLATFVDELRADRYDAVTAWERAGRDMLWFETDRRRVAVDEAFGDVIEHLRDGTAFDAGDVRELRGALQEAEWLVEEYLAAVAPGIEPWEDGAGPFTSYGVLREQLEDAGYEVVTPAERRSAARGREMQRGHLEAALRRADDDVVRRRVRAAMQYCVEGVDA